MLKAIFAVALAATSIGWVSLANAQTAPRSSVTMPGRPNLPPPPRVQTPGLGVAPGGGPTFNLFGIPTYITTPVAPPYANSAYRNFGGQPQRSSESILSEGGGP
jgi:hypothetical protein